MPIGELSDRLLRRDDVERRCGLSTTSLYRLMREGHFPLPLKIGTRAVRWSEAELEKWLAGRPRATGDFPGDDAE